MSYHFQHDESIEAGLRRIAIEQLDDALQAALDGGDTVAHELRKRCKKLRGLLRLVRGAFADYGNEQRAIRQAARELAAIRQSGAHLEALQRLECMPALADEPALQAARRFLESALQEHWQGGDLDAALDRATAVLVAQRARAPFWRLSDEGFVAIEQGLLSNYRSARRALDKARRRPDAERLHELRSRIKYHRYHLDLLHAIWPGPFLAWIDSAERVGERLGQQRDGALLLAELQRANCLDSAVETRVVAALAADSAALQDEAFGLAARLLADKPRRFRARMASYWESWRG